MNSQNAICWLDSIRGFIQVYNLIKKLFTWHLHYWHYKYEFPNSRNSLFFCIFYRHLNSCCNIINRYKADYLTLMLIKDIPFSIDNYPVAINRLSRVISYHCASPLEPKALLSSIVCVHQEFVNCSNNSFFMLNIQK